MVGILSTSGRRRICGPRTIPVTTPMMSHFQLIDIVLFSFSGLVALDAGNWAADGEEVDDLVQGGRGDPVAGQLNGVADGGIEERVEQSVAGLVDEIVIEPHVVDALVEREPEPDPGGEGVRARVHAD